MNKIVSLGATCDPIGAITDILTLKTSFVVVTTSETIDRKKGRKRKQEYQPEKVRRRKERDTDMKRQEVKIFSALSNSHRQILRKRKYTFISLLSKYFFIWRHICLFLQASNYPA